MDKYVCLKKSDVVIPAEGEEESSGGEDDEDDDEDEEEEEDGDGSDGGAPSAAKLEPVEVEEESEGEKEDVSEPLNSVCRVLTSELGSARESHAVFGCIQRRRSVSRRHY